MKRLLATFHQTRKGLFARYSSLPRKRKLIVSALVSLGGIALTGLIVWAATSSGTVGNSSTTAATASPTQRHMLRTSDGTLHSFVQAGSQTSTCNGQSRSGLLWFVSTDSGTTWTCREQLSSDTSNLMYASVVADASDNIYITYSVVANGAAAANTAYYRKLTKSGDVAWTLGSAQTIAAGSSGVGYSYSVIEVEGSTRLWVATRYFDGSNYQVSAYYSNDLSDAPTWTLSQQNLDTPGSNGSLHYPAIVRFGSKIGILYQSQFPQSYVRWRVRDDADGLTSWSPENIVSTTIGTAARFTAVGDSNGNVYFAAYSNATVYFTYWNGTVWSQNAIISTTGLSGGYPSLSTDGTNVWVFYQDTTNLTAALSGSSKLVYKKGVLPYSTADFDATATAVMPSHDVFDRTWRFAASGSTYTNTTTAAGNTTAADAVMPSAVGDIAYFGKTQQFDSMSWVLSTAGSGGAITWEYWNGSTWSALTFTVNNNAALGATTGYVAFNAPADWATTTVSDATPYYYIRARVTTALSVAPVGTQFVAIPNINFNYFLAQPYSNQIFGMWSENAASPIKVRTGIASVTSATPNTAGTTNIAPYTAAYSSTTLATQPSNQRHLVRTSDGTLHMLVQGQNVAACGSATTNNGLGLQWLYSTDNAQTWQCGSQLHVDSSTSNILMYGSATVDDDDNIYVTYSVAQAGASGLFNLYYRKLTKGEGATWTVGAQQTVQTAAGTEGYSFSVIEIDGTGRLWLAARYYDGVNYVIRVYYGSDTSDAPTWSVSSSAFDLANNGTQHVPAMVRFKDKIGIVYSSQVAVAYNNVSGQTGIRWRFRSDNDALTAWSNDSLVDGTTTLSSGALTAISDGTNVYVGYNAAAVIYLNFWDGVSWQPTITVTSGNSAVADNFISLSTDGSQIWVFYNDITNLNTNLPGNRNVVYKRCVFGGGGCQVTSTPMMQQYNIFDKYWSYVSSSYLNDTTDAGNVTASDTRMVTGVGDIAYFGKLEKFDSVSWSLSTNGAGGQVRWEYWNGSTWKEINEYLGTTNNTFLGSGYISFLSPADWATTTINSEGTPYYYVRARVVTAYTTTPVGLQVAALSQTHWGSFLPEPIAGKIYGMWTENSTSPSRIRVGTLDVPVLDAAASTNQELDPPVVGYSATTNAMYSSTQRKLVRTSDGTLHSFVQAHNKLACGEQRGNNNNGLMWIYSTDEGTTWTCGAQLSSDLTNIMYASAAVDANDNLYVTYSVINDGSNAAWSTYYRKFTKQSGANWTMENQQVVLDASSGLVAYTFSTIEVQGTDRLWLATRYFDGTNYQVSVYYSNNLSASPTWTLSTQSLGTPIGASGRMYPVLVRFGSKIGVLYNVAYSTAIQTRWRWRNDSDPLTDWAGEATVGTGENIGSPTFSAVGDIHGRVFYASNNTATTFFSYWNGTVWSPTTNLYTTTGGTSYTAFVSLITDNTNVWAILGDNTGMTGFPSNVQGHHRLAYKKGIAPFTATEWDATPTPIVSYHGVFDKYWSYVSSSFLDDTTDAGNITATDTRLVTGVGDAAYFGKLQKFDTVNWETPTAGVGGLVVWEYWNGTTWAGITSMQSNSNGNFIGVRGYISFTPPTDWATGTVNGEGTPYYYVRARVLTAFTTTPVATQFNNAPRSWMSSYLPNPVNGKLYGIWSENIGVAPVKVRFASTDVTTSTRNTTTATELKPSITSSTLYGGAAATVPNGTRYSTQRHMVRTSDGTLHAFVQATTAAPCGGSNSVNNTVGLTWVYSTDSGQSWSCGGQLSSDLTTLMYASATTDSNDNIYVVYSTDLSSANAFNSVYYRKLTKGSGSTWTLGSSQTVAAGSPTEGYSYPSIETDGTRTWVAARYFDNNNYQISVWYSSNLADNPSWTLSQRTLNTAGNSLSYHFPIVVRFADRIGVIYNSQVPTNLRWRWRSDADGLTSWNTEAVVSTSAPATATFSAIGDSSGNVYLATNTGTNVIFTYWNGSAWSANATVSNTAYSSGWVSLGLLGTNVYVYYGDTTGLNASLPGSRKFVYKKGVAPYAAANFDASATSVVNWHDIFNKSWRYVSASTTYTDVTTAAGNVTLADTTLPSAVDDSTYFGKLQKFDAVSWLLSTNGVGGRVTWEYWNGSSWIALNSYLGVLTPSFTATGYITFIPPDDWATTTVNGEGTPYYYLRARVVAAYSTPPVASQYATVPPISWGTVVGNASDLLYMWTEGGVAANRIRFSATYFNVAPQNPSNLGPTSVVSGGYISDSTPTLTFTTSDANVGDTVRYQLQISTNSDFSSPVVDYTSALAAAGAGTFTVGQAAGTGSYATGSEGQTLSDDAYYWRIITTDSAELSSSYTTANGGAIAFNVDDTAPDLNASGTIMLTTGGGLTVASNGWTNQSTPYFSWDGGSDAGEGSGVSGYCLYLGTDETADPATTKGLLGTSPVSTENTTCQFIVATAAIDFSTLAYQGATWLTTSNSPYYLNVKAIDSVGNIYTGESEQFQFRYDNTIPTNVSFISPAGGNFSNVADMSFTWPTSGANTSTDAHSGVLGWQYQINATDGEWLGATTSAALAQDYIPANATIHELTNEQDGDSIVSGNNTVYFRTIDTAGNVSSEATIRAGVLQFGGSAPSFAPTDEVTVTPGTSETNSFGVSWPTAVAGDGNTVSKYYYMINTTPPSTLATLQANASTYIDNGTSTTLSAAALPNVNRGTNTIYVVAIDDDDPANYSPTNYISGNFTLNSTNPDNVGNLIASDSSIKSQSTWNVTLTWTAPTYQGAGNLTYQIYRSADGTTFSQVGTSTGLSYVDSAPSSARYYYKVVTRDGAAAVSSGTNAVDIIPTGRWTTAPTLDSEPVVSNITTKKATISWTTNRAADTKIQFGTGSGSYDTVEPSNSTQVTGHTITLTGLQPGTTYYYKAKWSDEDGNTGQSSEKTFTTAPPPSVKDVSAGSISLDSALISFTTTGASSVKIYYGTTTAFGSVKTLSTSTSETAYTAELDGLTDGTKYYYKITTFDSDGSEYDNQVNDFTTLPRPKITNVRIQQVVNTAQSTLLITWTSNTEVSSIITYYPEGDIGAARDEVNVSLIKGQHRMIVSGLLPETQYFLTVRGRDKAGNEATSDTQKVNTATDTRAPQISELHVEAVNTPVIPSSGQESTSQIIMSWNTDEPATSQVEFGEGSGTTYAQKTQEDSALTNNHMVIISNLSPAKVYHVRANSKDKAGNLANSIDLVSITPKATDNAFNLVISSLQQVFGFLGGLRQ